MDFGFLDTLSTYDDLDSDAIKNYSEFSLASLLFYGMKEGACSEQSSRMTAMDSASKNAGKFSNTQLQIALKCWITCYQSDVAFSK